MIASTRLSERAGIDLGAFEDRRIEIRGRQRPLRVKLVGDARALPLEVAPAAGKGAPARVWLAGLGRRGPRSGDRDPRGAGRTVGMG
jgi:hypothetical protein